MKEKYIAFVMTVFDDGLVTFGVRASAKTVMINFGSQPYTPLEGLTH